MTTSVDSHPIPVSANNHNNRKLAMANFAAFTGQMPSAPLTILRKTYVVVVDPTPVAEPANVQQAV